jgi:hypothetical protein
VHLPSLVGDEHGAHRYGFGRVRLCGADADECARGIRDDALLSERQVKPHGAQVRYRRSISLFARLIGGYYGVDEPQHQGAGLLPQATVPIGRFLLIIALFTLVIGPGSLWVARRRSTFFLLLTIPGTAAITIGSIVLYSLLGEGLGAHATTRAVTLLDRKHDRAISVGVYAFYANLEQEGAAFGKLDAVLSPEEGERSEVPIDWTQGARFGAGFVPSRTYREWGVLSVRSSRARLTARATADGAVLVQNALGGKIRQGQVRLGGKLWELGELADGHEGRATPAALDAEPPGARLDYADRLDYEALERVDGPLAEGSFRALLQTNDALPLQGLELEHHESETLVAGEVDR